MIRGTGLEILMRVTQDQTVSKPRYEPLHWTGTLLTILLGSTARKQISESPQHILPFLTVTSEKQKVWTFTIGGFCTDP